MGWVVERVDRRGRIRFYGVYRDLQGRQRSTGGYLDEAKATRAWQRAEDALVAGRTGDPKKGKQTFRTYVEQEWLPHHVIEATTRESYIYVLNKHVFPEFGGRQMRQILPIDVRRWVLKMQGYGATPQTIRSSKIVLDAIFTTALNDQVVALHAGRGVKTPPCAKKTKRIVSAEQYRRLYEAIPDDTMRLMIELDIESGLRWGELTELRPKDIDLSTGMLTVSRVVVNLRSKERPDGTRFRIKDYPKEKKWREVKLAPHITRKLAAHIESHGLGKADLLFRQPQPVQAQRRTLPDVLPDPMSLGWTSPNTKGRQYRHGTASAYNAAPCRCDHCRNAIAAYRERRRAEGKDTPRQPRTVAGDDHISSAWFRVTIWLPALEAADLGFHITPHGLRHAHASWLLAGGADLQVVKERLGHGSITTTEKYLHTLPGAHEKALSALDAIRGQPADDDAVTPERQPPSTELELQELRAMVAKMGKLLGGLEPTA